MNQSDLDRLVERRLMALHAVSWPWKSDEVLQRALHHIFFVLAALGSAVVMHSSKPIKAWQLWQGMNSKNP